MADTRRGQVEVICGCMFSGKTEEMFRRLTRAQYAHQKIQVFAHWSDNRYGENLLASHNGKKLAAVSVQNAGEILPLIEPDTTVVAIDEAQFFDWNITELVEKLARRGIRVIVAGLETDFRGEPFGPMPVLMAQADLLDKFSAICVVCGGSATRTQRIINGHPARYNDKIILVGASEKYEARCRHCHEVPGKSM
ncbi:MAG: thymidine kinase [Patescibacteria group bacterium]